MKKKSKIIIIAISVIVAILVSIVIFDRFCWKYFDYYFCTTPKGLSYQLTEVQDDKVDIYFYPVTNFVKLWGYDYYIADDVLYVGIKTVTFGGESFGLPTIISVETEKKISKVVLKGAGVEEVVYENGKSKNYNGEWE